MVGIIVFIFSIIVMLCVVFFLYLALRVVKWLEIQTLSGKVVSSNFGETSLEQQYPSSTVVRAMSNEDIDALSNLDVNKANASKAHSETIVSVNDSSLFKECEIDDD